MKFYVSTVLGSRDNFTISGDVFYIDEKKVEIAGVEHDLFYGDIVQHGDFSYYINENHVSTKGFDNEVEDFWYLHNGELPDDGKKYLLKIDPNVCYDGNFLKHYAQFENKIVSRENKIVKIHVENWDKIFCKRDNKTYTKDFKEYTESYDSFVLKCEEYQENLKTELRENLKPVVSEEIQENEEFVSRLVEKTFSLIPIPKDGKDGKDGKPGPKGDTGLPGPTGPKGIKGDKGDSGTRGPEGAKGDKGDKGDAGARGPKGGKGDKGDRGPKGEKGEKGDPGPIGESGPPGEKGEKGDPGQVILNEETISGYETLKKEFEKFKDIDTKYKSRLNTQLASLGGGGSAKILDNDDVVFSRPSQLSNNDILVWDGSIRKFSSINIVDVINNIRADLEMQYDKLVDEQTSGNNTFTYVGEAAPGSITSSASWRIKRITEYANGYMEIIWANDTEDFDKIWDDRGTYTYTV